ncbi:MAG: hypothetical protein V3R82_01140 [Candidatus Hydrothermarchaeales archaeon]
MTNQRMVEDLLQALIRVGSKITSDKYILLVINTLIRDLRREYEVFNYLKIVTTSHGFAQVINVSPEVNSIDNKSLGESLSVFIERLIGPAGLRGQESFGVILEYEMGLDLVRSLKRLGVKIT